MNALNLVLLAAGIAAMAAGIVRIRGPYRRLEALKATDENLRRYEDWRGGRRRIDAPGETGADVMRRVLRDQVRAWGLVVAGGLLLVFLAFFLR
jgi:hypothetical protein